MLMQGQGVEVSGIMLVRHVTSLPSTHTLRQSQPATQNNLLLSHNKHSFILEQTGATAKEKCQKIH